MDDTPQPRFVVLFEKHFGLGLRWLNDDYYPFPLHVSLAIPFVTFEMGIGRRRSAETVSEQPSTGDDNAETRNDKG